MSTPIPSRPSRSKQRKLWLLNGSHSQLAYAGSILGHSTIDQAIADPDCRHWVTQFWDEASRHLNFPRTKSVPTVMPC
jgi:fructuronate reductase